MKARYYIFAILILFSALPVEASTIFGHNGQGYTMHVSGILQNEVSGFNAALRFDEFDNPVPAYLTGVIFKAYGSTTSMLVPQTSLLYTSPNDDCSAGTNYTGSGFSTWSLNIPQDQWILVQATTSIPVPLSGVRCIVVLVGQEGTFNTSMNEFNQIEMWWQGDDSPNASSTVPSLGAAAPNFDTSQCNIVSGSFSMSGCLSVLLGWSSSAMAYQVIRLDDAFFALGPMTVVAQFRDAFSTATTSLPAIEIGFPTSIGDMDTSEIGSSTPATIDVQGAINTAAAILATEDDSGNSMWDYLMPWINSIMWGLFSIAVLFDILGHQSEQRIAKKV